MHVPHRFSGIGTRRRCSAAPWPPLTPLLSLALTILAKLVEP